MSPIAFRLGIMMFLQFFVWGAWYVTVGNYMKAHGMFDSVASAYMVGPLAAIIAPFFLGLVADRFFATERVLSLLHLLGAVAMLAAPMFAADANMFVLMLLAHMLCYMPTLGLTNTLTFHNIQNQEKEFPVIRVFGTVGWIVANLVVSSVFNADETATQFYVTAAAGAALALFSLTLPHTPPPAAGKKVAVRDILGLDALSLLKNPSFAVFVVCSFLICIPLAAYYAFAPIFAGTVGIENVASRMSLGQFSEIIFMLVMPLFFARLGVKWMLAVGMLAWVARYGLFAGAAQDNVIWMVTLGILLHGICYDFFFVTGFIYTDKKCSKEIRGQAQGLLVLVTQGLGLGIGAELMGRLVGRMTPPEAAALQAESAALAKEAYATSDMAARSELLARAGELGNQASAMIDWQNVWLVPCVAAGVIMLLFIVLFRDRVDTTDTAD